MPDALARVLEAVERCGRVVRDGEGYRASCPVVGHGRGQGDRNPSLAIRRDGAKVLLHCHAMCHPQDVMLALGLDWPDLFDEPITNHRGELVADWTYQHRDGSPYFVVERWQGPRGKFFRQRMPDADRAGLPTGFKPCLYKMPQVLAAVAEGKEVWIVEGEKCVAAAERLGVVATTAPMGAGKWKDYYSTWLKDCVGVNIVCDNDDVGKTHAAGVAVSIRGVGVPVKTWQVWTDDEKADLYDHVVAGYGVGDLRPVKLNRLRPEGTSAHCLLTAEYPPIRWAIEGLLPAGLALLGGPPKLAKSMVALDMALGVACGGRALSELHCCHGSVLYLSLDNDGERRLAIRARHLLRFTGVETTDLPIEFHCDWPTGEAAIRSCQEWVDDEVDERREPLLIVIDTLGKVEPNFEGGQYDNAYLCSTATLSRWSKFAADNDVAVLAIHHDRKSADDDWLNRFTGSRGITATAQTLMMIEAKRGEPSGWLRVVGRDLETEDLPLTRSGWGWITNEDPSKPLRLIEGGG